MKKLIKASLRQMFKKVRKVRARASNWFSDFIRPLFAKVIKKLALTFEKLLKWLKTSPRKFLNLFAQNIYGIWLLRPWSSRAGYILVFLVSLIAIVLLDYSDFGRVFIHMQGANEAIIGVFTILLALLIPISIALIEDARESVLARQTIVKTIIRFNRAPVVLILICLFFFIPQGLHVLGASVTVRTLYVAILACCAVFILSSFYRAFRWLNDASTYSSGSSASTPPEDDPNAGAFSSYRFAWIVRLLRSAKGYQTWSIIWSQWFPVGYEDTLHVAFFDRAREVFKAKKTRNYVNLSIELEAYNRFFEKRNKSTFQFELSYPKEFLSIYANIDRTIEADSTFLRTDNLWRGKEASKSVIEKMTDLMMTRNRIWHMFDAMENYATSRNLINVGSRKEVQEDEVLRRFLETYFEAVISKKLDSYSSRSQFDIKKPWAVTYDNLYVKRYNLSFIVQMVFKEWLFEKLDKHNSKEYLLKIDSLLNSIFPRSDPITLGSMYWLFYLMHQATESVALVELYINENRPFGHIGRSTGFYEVRKDVDEAKQFSDFYRTQESDAVRVFANLYAPYLRSNFWNPSEILILAESANENDLSEVQSARLKELVFTVKLILNFYEDSDSIKKSHSKK